MKLTEKSIQRSLYHFYNQLNHKLIAPNIHLYYGEADLITVQTSGYTNEIEIKLNKADFKRDFKKRKHLYMALAKKAVSKVHLPNYFWFAFPLSLMEKIDFEVPGHYGMITVNEEGWPNIYRRAKLLHRGKITDKQVRQIARSLMFKMWRYEAMSENCNK
jgi:Holliday junction resolvase-like predicted endonuclease